MSCKSKVVTLKDTESRVARLWDDLIGFEGVDGKLHALWTQNRLPQVLVIDGRAGIGKRKFMARFAAHFFCESEARRACGQCEGCHSVQHGYQQDLFWLETEGPIKVADAESLQEHLSYQAQSRPRLAVIIDIEKLNDQASNRLLKVLEEPPQGVLILASCSRFDKLLPTIRSRAVRFRVAPPQIEQSLELLQGLLLDAGRSDQEIEAALRMYGLSIGRALATLKHATSEQKIRLERLQRLLLLPIKGETLQELSGLLKEQAWKAPDLAQFFEIALNQSYRRLCDHSSAVNVQDFRRIKHWRKILQQVYRAGGTGQNNLNVQLVAEALISPVEG